MKAKELKIGDIVQYEGTVLTIEEVGYDLCSGTDNDGVWLGTIPCERITPIPPHRRSPRKERMAQVGVYVSPGQGDTLPSWKRSRQGQDSSLFLCAGHIPRNVAGTQYSKERNKVRPPAPAPPLGTGLGR